MKTVFDFNEIMYWSEDEISSFGLFVIRLQIIPVFPSFYSRFSLFIRYFFPSVTTQVFGIHYCHKGEFLIFYSLDVHWKRTLSSYRNTLVRTLVLWCVQTLGRFLYHRSQFYSQTQLNISANVWRDQTFSQFFISTVRRSRWTVVYLTTITDTLVFF